MSDLGGYKPKPLNGSIHPLDGRIKPLSGRPSAPKRRPPTHHKPRPKKPDPLQKSMRWLAFCGWLLIMGAIFVAGLAQPQTKTYYHRRSNVAVRDIWNYDVAPFILLLCLLALIVSIVGLCVNIAKSHPKGDFVHINFIVLCLTSVTGIVLYLVYLL